MPDEKTFDLRYDLYELDHLFGCWIRALPDLREHEEETGEEVPLTEIYGWLFLGDSVMVALDFDNINEDDEIFMLARWYTYRTEDARIIGRRLVQGDDGELVPGDDTFEMPWGLGNDGLLYMDVGERPTRYSPVDLDTLVEWGFDRELLERTIERGKAMGMPLVERFDPDGEYAQLLKAEYWRRVEDGER